MKTVYACFTTDIIHAGHLNIIREAQKYGQLTIGVMSDEALVRFDRFPTKTLEALQWCGAWTASQTSSSRIASCTTRSSQNLSQIT